MSASRTTAEGLALRMYLPSPPLERFVQDLTLEAQLNPLLKPILSEPGTPPSGTETISAMANEGSKSVLMPLPHMAPGAEACQSRSRRAAWGLSIWDHDEGAWPPIRPCPAPKGARKLSLTSRSFQQSPWLWLCQNVLLPVGRAPILLCVTY